MTTSITRDEVLEVIGQIRSILAELDERLAVLLAALYADEDGGGRCPDSDSWGPSSSPTRPLAAGTYSPPRRSGGSRSTPRSVTAKCVIDAVGGDPMTAKNCTIMPWCGLFEDEHEYGDCTRIVAEIRQPPYADRDGGFVCVVLDRDDAFEKGGALVRIDQTPIRMLPTEARSVAAALLRAADLAETTTVQGCG